MNDFSKVLPIILERGGFAVVSTLVGLVAMNLLKIVHEDKIRPQDEQQAFIQQFSKSFADEFTKSLGSTTETASFAENLARLSGQLVSGASSMEKLQSAAENAEAALRSTSDRMQEIVSGMGQFETLTNRLLPVWDEIPNQVAEATKLNTALANSAKTMSELETSSANSAKQIQAFALGMTDLKVRTDDMLQQITGRIEQLNRFGDEVVRFLNWAKTATPVLNTLHEGFGNIAQIKANLEAVTTNLERANSQLVTFNGGTIELTESSGTFGRNIGTLSKQIESAAKDLARLSDPMKRIGEMAEMAGSASDWFEGHSVKLEAFKNHLTDLVATAELHRNVVTQAKDAVQASVAAVDSFKKDMEKLADLAQATAQRSADPRRRF